MSVPAVVGERAAELVDIAGVTLAVHYGDPGREYEAARRGVGLEHRGRRGLVRFSGADHRRFLHGLLTSNVLALEPGSGGQALFLDTKGHVRGALDLWADDDAIVAGCDLGFVETVLPDLAKYVLGAEVAIEDRRGRESVIALRGDGGESVLSAAGFEPPEGGQRAHKKGGIAGIDVRVARTPDLGGPGFEVHAPVEDVDAVWQALEKAAHDLAPACVGWSAAEVLRVEAGVAAYGHEITGAEFPQEARLDDAIDYEKGCYLGQETVARIHYRGQVNRLLSGLQATAPLTAGAELLLSDVTVGTVTSAVVSPRLGPIAVGYVRRQESEAGATVTAGDGEARIVPLPFAD